MDKVARELVKVAKELTAEGDLERSLLVALKGAASKLSRLIPDTKWGSPIVHENKAPDGNKGWIDIRVSLKTKGREWGQVEFISVWGYQNPEVLSVSLRFPGNNSEQIAKLNKIPTAKNIVDAVMSRKSKMGEIKFLKMFGIESDAKDEPFPIKDLKELASRNAKWFDFESDGGDELHWSSREYGDVGSESAGKEDMEAAKKLISAIKKKYPQYDVSGDVVDEWVYVVVKK